MDLINTKTVRLFALDFYLRPRQLSQDRNLELITLLLNRNICESLAELEKVVETRACGTRSIS